MLYLIPISITDLHPGNIMLQDGKLVIIDMPEVTMGPPILDLTSIYRSMIVSPQRNPELLEKTVGMPVDMLMKAGRLFFVKYTGITDQEELEVYFKKLGLLYAFNISLIPGAGVEEAIERVEAIKERVLRPVVVPNEQVIGGLLRTM